MYSVIAAHPFCVNKSLQELFYRERFLRLSMGSISKSFSSLLVMNEKGGVRLQSKWLRRILKSSVIMSIFGLILIAVGYILYLVSINPQIQKITIHIASADEYIYKTTFIHLSTILSLIAFLLIAIGLLSVIVSVIVLLMKVE